MIRLTVPALLVLVASGLGRQTGPASGDKRPRNVLFLISDDLSAGALSCYGNRQCHTPAIDKLAARGVRFARAYCQFPVCGPSRAALMSGMYPQAIGVMGNGQSRRFTRNLGQRPSLAGLFKQNGYVSVRVSKIYHMRVPGDITAGVHGPDHAASWSERYSFQAPEWMTEGEHEHLTREKLRRDRDKHYNLGFGGAFYVVRGESDGREQADVKAADKAIEIMKKHRERPFFLAVGFVRPHVPLVAPAGFFAPYPPRKMHLPRQVENDWSDIPPLGISKNSHRSGLTTAAKKRKVLSAYYAAVAFMDAQVDRVLQALDDLGLTDDTIVVFTSDHGYHLGEHEFWQKMSLHEESARIPLIVAAPGKQAATTDALAQQIDIYPTLAELCGLEIPAHVQGKSLARVLDEPGHRVHEAAYCFKRNGSLVRTRSHAYIAWNDGTAELYDMREDPRQFTNLAGSHEAAKVVRRMKKLLDAKLQEIRGR